MDFERVLNGVVRYFDREIYSNMNNWQEFMARLAVSRILGNKNLENLLRNNPYIKTFAIMDESGNVDIDGLYRDMKSVIQSKGRLEFELPMFGKFTFTENDVDCLYNCIVGG